MTDTQITSGDSADGALNWYKSSSCPSQATCVEAAALPGGAFALRDGKRPQDPHLLFAAASWRDFLAGVRAGEFDPAER